MFANLSLLFLSFSSKSYSPIMSSTLNSFPVSNYYHRLNINHLFSSFYFKKVQYSENFKDNNIIITDASFSNTLNSVIFISSSTILKNEIYDTQYYIGSDKYESLVSITNCCFFNCTDSAIQQNGGAICINVNYCNLIIVQTLFSRCYSNTIGGAIFNVGHGFEITSSEFSDCESIDTGGSIFSNFFKHYGDGYASTCLYHSQILNTECKYLPIDINASHMACNNCNFTNNINSFHSDPTARQQCFGFPFISCGNSQKFKYVNYVGNDGDCIMEINFKAYSQILSVNVINNINLNFFFYNDPDGPQSTEMGEGPNISCQNFAFFGNQKSSLSDRIKVANVLDPYKFVLKNCYFDYSPSEVNSMLNGHYEVGGQYSMQTKSFTHSDVLNQPVFCVIPSSDFTLSAVFTFSDIFSVSSIFSESSIYSESSTFSESSAFSESLTFYVPTFTPSSSLTPDILTQTKQFTPSSPFTPSNFFTPNRTKVPDPQNIFHRPEISGNKNNIFTKEELKKAAGPVSISLILIIVAIVFTVLYLRRKIYELRHQVNISDFDSSFNDESDSDSEYSYSYSYYTYEYYYTYRNDYSYKSAYYDDSYSSFDSQILSDGNSRM